MIKDKKGVVKHFYKESEANNYSENHESPDELNWDTIEEIHVRTLELLTLHNPIRVISKVLNVSGEEFTRVLKILENNNLVKNCGKNWLDKYACDRYEITPYGEIILNRELEK